MFIWRGVGASEEELEAAKHVAGFLGGSATQVSEGKEPGEDQYSNVPYTIRENGITKENHCKYESCKFLTIGLNLTDCYCWVMTIRFHL